jgi:hypothetical protein
MRQALMDECRRDRDGLPRLMDDFERLLAELGAAAVRRGIPSDFSIIIHKTSSRHTTKCTILFQ